MASKTLLFLSLGFLPLSLFGDVPADYANRGAQKYIFGQERAAEDEISQGLAKFPNDKELQQMSGLFRKKPPQQQNNQSQGQQDQQQQSSSQNQPQSQQQDKNQETQQKQDKDRAQAKNEHQQKPQPQPNGSPSPSSSNEQQNQPSPSPGEEKQEQSRGSQKQDASPVPGEGTPSPSPREATDENGVPSPSPTETPQKKLGGQIREANGDESDKSGNQAQIEQAEAEKEGQMSAHQAEQLLKSMKDEEARVQLDEHRQVRRVYKDW